MSAFSTSQDSSACFPLLAAKFWAWGWGASSTLSWNAVDFLNPHQSILGLRGRAYLKPPFPRELRLESVSEQLADPPPQLLSFVFLESWSKSKMEEDIADEEKDLLRGKGNELSQLGLFEEGFC